MFKDLLLTLVSPLLLTVIHRINIHVFERYKSGFAITTLIILTSILSAVILPIVILFNHHFYTILASQKAVLIFIGIADSLAAVFYMNAVMSVEDDIVEPFFQFTPVIGFFLGFIFIGEFHPVIQIINAAIIVLGSYLLLHNFQSEIKTKRYLKTLILMFFCSFFYALHLVLFKIVASEVTYTISIFWEYIGIFISGIFLLLVKSYREAFINTFKKNHLPELRLTLMMLPVSILSNIIPAFVSLLVPITLLLFMNTFQPFFSLIASAIIYKSQFNRRSNRKLKQLRILGYILMMIVLLYCSSFFTQTKITYSRHEVMIPMRDGTKLFTIYYTPDKINEEVPILMSRTPYGSKHIWRSPFSNDALKDMADDGYIFVMQDIRGRYNSEGKFTMNAPILDRADATDESTDTYDAIEWLIKNTPHNNGKTGLVGASYLGWLTLVGAARPHPSLKAASEQACMSDLFLGDDFHHNGAFRLSFTFDYIYLMESKLVPQQNFQYDDSDMYSFFLKLGPLNNANKKYFHGELPSWNLIMEHPNYDSFWKYRSPLRYIGYPRIPIMHVGGLWDQEDIMGPQLMYSTQEKLDTNNRNYICLGPWNHTQWEISSAYSVGFYNTGSNTTGYFQKNIQKKWFKYWLKGKGDKSFAEATVFQTGSNRWQTYNSWPPHDASVIKLYTSANGIASFDKPTTNAVAYDEYISDPGNPVPYCQRPIKNEHSFGNRWSEWITDNQSFLDKRPDVLSWQTDTIKDSLIVTGEIVAHVMAATSGTDADWVVKLIDVYPDVNKVNPSMNGYKLMVAAEVFRGRFRNSFELPQAIPPGKVQEYTIDMHQINHVFKKGHHIMIQIQSSWFPLIDMNPQKFVPSIYNAAASDYVPATQKIYRSSDFSTYIELPVMQSK